MIDLSHLTEEEQEMIMTVLRRDADLKKAEEERIGRLEETLSSGKQSDIQLKYFTGEWFYEAKSRRHTDKIHGSEIILASMKQGKASSLDGSLRIERSRISSSRSSDVVAPQKPARSFEAVQPKEISDPEKENQDLSVRSPRLPRYNPFNRASLIVVEPPENNKVTPTDRDQDLKETEPISPLKSPPACESSPTSGVSVTSEGSSLGFRPVPKKRTFLSRRPGNQSKSNGLGLDTQVGSAGVVPTPRRRLQKGSSGSSNQSKSRDEIPLKNTATASNQVTVQPVQTSRPADQKPQQHICDSSQVSSNSSLERGRYNPSMTSERTTTYTTSEVSSGRETAQKREERADLTQREQAALSYVSNLQDRESSSQVERAMRLEDLSLPQSTVDPDPPISYDLHFIDTADPQVQKPNQIHAFKLSTQTTSPTGDEEDSIAKVLDWFSRSVDSSEWLNAVDSPDTTKSSYKHAEVSKSREVEISAKDPASIVEDRSKERPETKGSVLKSHIDEDKELRKGTKELIETQRKMKEDIKQNMQEVEDNADESQPAKISHLKSFWEKSNAGPKILIGKSATAGDKEQKTAQILAEKESDIHSAPGTYSQRGIYDKYTSNQSDEKEPQLVISPQMSMGASFQLSNHQPEDDLVINSIPRYNNELTCKSDHLKSPLGPQVVDRSSEAETFNVTKLSPQERRANSPEFERLSLAKSKPDSFEKREPTRQEELSKTFPTPQLDTDLQTRGRLDSEKRASPYVSVDDRQIFTGALTRKDSSDDGKRRETEDKGVLPKAREEASNRDRANSPHSNRQESTAERIKQLKSFWEQERNKPMFYTGKPKPLGEGKVPRGANQAKLNKRFTKSEYDLRSMGKESDSDEESTDKNHQNFTVLPMNQRLDKVSPSLSSSRSQFNHLREFWDEASSDSKAPFSSDKTKSPKRKEPNQLPHLELKHGDTEPYHPSSAVEKTRSVATKLSPHHRSKSPHDRTRGPVNDNKSNLPCYMSAESGQQRLSKRNSKDSVREEKSVKNPQSSPRKELRSPKTRKDSFGNSSSRGGSLRRATSMFALSIPGETDKSHLRMDVSPVHSQSRKPRQNAEKVSMSRGSSEESQSLSPTRARAFVPTDYRHYLGMTDRNSVHTSLAPAMKDEGSGSKSGHDLDLSGPARASTPVSSEERHSTRDSRRAQQRPLWATYSSSETGPESSMSSASESWSTSRKSREKDDEENPVRKALWRAETRPKNLAKSMEDIIGSLSPRQERRPDMASELRRISDASSIPSPSSSLFSDPDHLKKMSKSVPLFLENEDAGRENNSRFDHGYNGGNLLMGSSMTNLNSSSGMMSMSPLSGSVMTMYSGDFGNVEVQGNIQFSINYIQRLREFHIFVAQCRGLATVDPKRRSADPYVKSYLVPDKANLGKRKTSVKKKTLNPTFNEILRYRVRMEYLRTQTLILSVWHHDTFGRNSFLGEVDVDLSKWDFDHTQMNYLALKARTTPTLAPSNLRGEMRVAVRFLPQITHSQGVSKEGPNTGEIHIWVKDCKNLPLIRATIDPYVKCFVLPDTSRKSRQKTRVLRRTVDPVFNHTMVYDGIREADLSEACVELSVWDRDRLASNLLGGLRLGAGTGRSYGALVDWMDSTPDEVALWERMMSSPNEWVEDVLPLRMLNCAKTAFR